MKRKREFKLEEIKTEKDLLLPKFKTTKGNEENKENEENNNENKENKGNETKSKEFIISEAFPKDK